MTRLPAHKRLGRRLTRKLHVLTAKKVFCIGFQRTGTRTLATALDLLGYAPIHSADPAVHDDVDAPVFSRYSAFCDFPFPLMYERLDRRYPGSRFILTVRDVEGWLTSCSSLFQLSDHWDAKPHGLHTLAYGQTTFDARVMRERYERHNQEVRSYFAGRPDDFLEMDLPAGDGWQPLCRFLGKPVPPVEFPHKNKSGVLGRYYKAVTRSRG